MLYILAAAAAVCVMLFAALYVIYIMAFASRRDIHPKDDEMPANNPQYMPYAQRLSENVRRLAEIPFEPVYITSFDGLRLYGRFYDTGEDSPVAILFHGYRSTALRDASGGAPFCLKRGISVLLVDQRSHGKSEGRAITFGVRERRDCKSWIDYVISRRGSDVPIILMGVSMGAATVLMAPDLKLPENVKGIVADCPYSSPMDIICTVSAGMGIPSKLVRPFIWLSARIFAGTDISKSSAVKAAGKSHIPAMLIHGDDDRFVPFDMSLKIAKANTADYELTPIAGAGHGIAYYVDTEAYESAAERILTIVRDSRNA